MINPVSMLIFIRLENYHRVFICSVYISYNTLGSLERSFATVENYSNHSSGNFECPVNLPVPKKRELGIARAKSLVAGNVTSLFIHAVAPLSIRKLCCVVLRKAEMRFEYVGVEEGAVLGLLYLQSSSLMKSHFSDL